MRTTVDVTTVFYESISSTELVVFDLRKVGKDVDCVSKIGNPIAATTVTKTMHVILSFYGDDDFQECLENEGIDALSFIQKCVKKEIRETLKKIG